MLHEILLSLSGQPSPLFALQGEEDTVAQDAFPLLAPPEKALLASLARLSRLHARLRNHTSIISSSHPSVICRAVSTAIVTEHLGGLQKKILEVEKAVLVEDSGYVGGYGIVPLSTIVGEFAPWTRRLEWLWEVARFIYPEHKKSYRGCTGAALIDHLRAESQTGYADLEEMALQLVTAAERAWMRQLSMWLLHGTLPTFGKDDFFIQEDDASEGDDSGVTQFAMHTDRLPKFVSASTASSILFIGKSLNHIRAKRKASSTGTSTSLLTSPVTLHAKHIESLAALESPMSSSKLSNAVNAIRLALSQSTLSKLLPLPKILEMLSVLHNFMLLQRGEFVTALVALADARTSERHRRGKALGGLVGLKPGDLANTLAKAWTELYALQNAEDSGDDELDLARDLLQLSIDDQKKTGHSQDTAGHGLADEISSVSFSDLLFPTPTFLSIQVRPPMDLFLSTTDISVYSKIHSYLLGIRRAQLRLSDLWKHTSLRRSHPSPWGPPRSSTRAGQNRLKRGRDRDNARIVQMRPVWATTSAALYVLSEIGSFFQGEVVNCSWQHFREWIEGGPSHAGSRASSRPGTASSSKQKEVTSFTRTHTASVDDSSQSTQYDTPAHDPETLTVAHRRHLYSLVQSLFLTDIPFTTALRSLLTIVDRFLALVVRLESIQRNMDLETDEGVVDGMADYASEEREVLRELNGTQKEVKAGIQNVVARLRDIDDSRSGEGRRMFDLARNPNQNWSLTLNANNGLGSTELPNANHYVPRKAAGVDQLLMKLDFGNVNDDGA
ncbi:putative gamma-tubulin complex component GCP4 [Aspergillus glaucus CBS 516.65]|uniref:Spindle pole body component n=1 Tax=Aspergillus glaucus CBS 516.65 TaxID=1160497 RepID=A0A1L9VXH0_ASPGL|nr:hypothetical protein ASPGLDRAFT_141236 [Aspergillus glaucus CBS 516.65]OJJ88589.1 hypothetical protein ASPGLDRAFT_141236 [Aspergillus glaucus CBS 516.65]